MTKKNKKQPSRRARAPRHARDAEHELAVALEHYTTPGDPEYDVEFDAEIRRSRPDWFAAAPVGGHDNGEL